MMGMRKHLVEAAIRGDDAAAPTITSYTSWPTTQNNTLMIVIIIITINTTLLLININATCYIS